MDISAEAIVLRRRDSGESDRRITVLTEEFGKFDAVAKGARKPASRLAAVTEPLAVAQFTFAKGKVNRFVTQAVPKSAYRKLRSDYIRLGAALAYCESVAALSPYDRADAETYREVRTGIEAIESHSNAEVALIWAQMRLIESSGFLPEFTNSVASGEQVTGDRRWFSAVQGGVLQEGESSGVSDALLIRREVIIGLSKITGLESPPATLKFADDCLKLLLVILRNVADTALPANESLHAALSLQLPK